MCIRDSLNEDELEDDEDFDGSESPNEEKQKDSQADKIISIINKSSPQEKIDWTNGLPILANKIEKKALDGLLPALKLLSQDEVLVKKALLN